jgi:NADH dehydrogenase
MKKESLKKVVIIGGGFGGLYATAAFKQIPVEVTLTDRHNYHLFQLLLYQVATGELSPGDIAAPLRSVFRKQKNVRVVLGTVLDFLPDQKRVVLADNEISYDYLIISAGSQHHYFGNDQWEKLAPGLKTIEDALDIRNRILLAFEKAELETDPIKRKTLLTFVIVGGGPTGVELAGAIVELARWTLKEDFRNINTGDAKIIIIEGTERILPPYPVKLSFKAQQSLNRLGVEVLTNTFVTDVTENSVAVQNKQNEKWTISAATILWAAGIKPSSLGQVLTTKANAELDKAGRVIVQQDCSIPNYPDIFVIGDLAHFKDKNGNPLPGVGAVPMQQGRYIADLVKKRLQGKAAQPFKYKDKGSLAVIGRAAAVAYIFKLNISGYPAWLLWVFVHLLYLVGFESRVLVATQWAFNYFTKYRGARLITGNDK